LSIRETREFPKAARLLARADFQRVFDDAVRSSDTFFTILGRVNDQGIARLGLAIAKKSLPLAVQRNRIKRLVRESFRNQQQLLSGLDIVVMARKGLQDKTNSELLDSLNRHWSKLVRKCAQS
jgi:ribonuclease P protein component